MKMRLTTACIAVAAASTVHAQPSASQRTAAARTAAETNEKCRAVQPFYWSIGDARGVLADGSVGARAPTATTPHQVFEASTHG